jgi:hypothetical protein
MTSIKGALSEAAEKEVFNILHHRGITLDRAFNEMLVLWVMYNEDLLSKRNWYAPINGSIQLGVVNLPTSGPLTLAVMDFDQ